MSEFCWKEGWSRRETHQKTQQPRHPPESKSGRFREILTAVSCKNQDAGTRGRVVGVHIICWSIFEAVQMWDRSRARTRQRAGDRAMLRDLERFTV